MLKASEIKMVRSINPDVLQQNINALLKENWTLHGELKVYASGEGHEYLQPMVKLEMFEPGGGLGINQGMPPILIPRG